VERAQRVELEPYRGIIDSARAWQNEYHRISPVSTLERDLLAALAVAGGAVSVDDLVALLRERHPSLAHLDEDIRGIIVRFGTSLRHVCDPGGDLVSARRYQFAHPSFGYEARNDPMLPHEALKRRLAEWAQDWRRRDWPDSTPLYLLQDYPVRLREYAPADLVKLTTDLSWIVLAIRRAGANAVVARLMAARVAGPNDPVVAALLSTVRGQAETLESSHDPSAAFVLRQLCLQAAELGETSLEGRLRLRLRQVQCTEPRLVPLWTTRKAHRALVSRLDPGGGPVNAVAGYQQRQPSGEGFLTGPGCVVGGGDDGRVWTWDLEAAGAGPRLLGHHVGAVRALTVWKDGRVVSGGDDRRLLSWKSPSGTDPACPVGVHNGAVTALGWDESGRLLSVGHGGQVNRWDMDGDPIAEGGETSLGRYLGVPTALAALPGGRVAVGGRHDATPWVFPTLPGGRSVRERDGGAVSALLHVPDGRYQGALVVGEENGTLCAWDVQDRRMSWRELGRLPGGIVAAVRLADGRLATGGRDGRIHAWHLQADRPQPVEIGRHEGPVRAMAAFPNGRVVTSGQDGFVCVWDPTGTESPEQPRLDGDASLEAVRSVAWVGPAFIAVGEQGGLLRIRSFLGAAGPPAPDVAGIDLGGAVVSMAVTGQFPGATVVATRADGALFRWTPASRPDAEYVGLHPGAVVTALESGGIVSGGYDGRVLRWDGSPRDPHAIGRHHGAVTGIARLPGDRLLTAGVDGHLLVWNPQSNRQTPERDLYSVAPHPIHALAVLGDTVIYGGEPPLDVPPGTASPVWARSLSGGPASVLGVHQGWVTTLGVIGSNRVVSAGTDDRVRLWDVSRRTQEMTIVCSAQSVACGVLPNGLSALAVAHLGSGLTVWKEERAPRGKAAPC
jgi:WD40 repeat protein